MRDLLPGDRKIFLSMVKSFYLSAAVAHNVDSRNFEKTFEAALSQSPFIRIFIIEDQGVPAGYAILSFTYSNEAGGMVVLIEELYISETYRGKGLGRKFFEFLEQEYPLAKRFRLEVTKTNQKAMALYDGLGYDVLDYVQMVKDI